MRNPLRDLQQRYDNLQQEYRALVAAHDDITADLNAKIQASITALQALRNKGNDLGVAVEHQRLAVVLDDVAGKYERDEVDGSLLTPSLLLSQLAGWFRDGAGLEPFVQPKLRIVKPPPVACGDCDGGVGEGHWQCLTCKGTGQQ